MRALLESSLLLNMAANETGFFPSGAERHNRLFIPNAVSLPNGYPAFAEAFRNELADIPESKISYSDRPDQTPQMVVANAPRGTVALMPCILAGAQLRPNLEEVSMAGGALWDTHEEDSERIGIGVVEGRGDKRTTNKDGQCISDLELMMVPHITRQLRHVGMLDKLAVLDPHAASLAEHFGADRLIGITALPELIQAGRERGHLSDSDRVVILDNGATFRALLYAEMAENTVGARLIKRRVDGKPTIVGMHGSQNLAGETAILVDDMTSKGGTLEEAAKAAKAAGAARAIGIVTHYMATPEAPDTLARILREGVLDLLYITDSMAKYRELQGIDGVEVVNFLQSFAKCGRALLEPYNERLRTYLGMHTFPMVDHASALGMLKRRYPLLAPDIQIPSSTDPAHHQESADNSLQVFIS